MFLVQPFPPAMLQPGGSLSPPPLLPPFHWLPIFPVLFHLLELAEGFWGNISNLSQPDNFGEIFQSRANMAKELNEKF